jgi:hypothetical protein
VAAPAGPLSPSTYARTCPLPTTPLPQLSEHKHADMEAAPLVPHRPPSGAGRSPPRPQQTSPRPNPAYESYQDLKEVCARTVRTLSQSLKT